MSACITNGASAKHTSGPSSPSAIALRTIGLTAYATAVATPGSGRPRERPREAVRAERAERQRAGDDERAREVAVAEEQPVLNSAISPNAGAAGVSAPIIA